MKKNNKNWFHYQADGEKNEITSDEMDSLKRKYGCQWEAYQIEGGIAYVPVIYGLNAKFNNEPPVNEEAGKILNRDIFGDCFFRFTR